PAQPTLSPAAAKLTGLEVSGMPDPTHNGELKMRKLLTATALVATLFSGSAFAKDDLVDYSDKSVTTCDKDEIEEKMTALAENGRAGKMGVNLLYLKG